MFFSLGGLQELDIPGKPSERRGFVIVVVIVVVVVVVVVVVAAAQIVISSLFEPSLYQNKLITQIV